MKPKYMLDTNICIYLMKHQPPEVRARFDECFVGDVVISAFTLAELELGIACSGDPATNQAALESLLDDILVAPFEAQAARAYGPQPGANRERNKNALDKLTTPHALARALNIVLVTNNEVDFLNYPDLAGENWVNSN